MAQRFSPWSAGPGPAHRGGAVWGSRAAQLTEGGLQRREQNERKGHAPDIDPNTTSL